MQNLIGGRARLAPSPESARIPQARPTPRSHVADPTRWTLIEAVRRAEPSARELFAQRYLPVVRAYLESRWRSSRLRSEAEDAAQEVFARCFEQQGPMSRLKTDQPGGFRAYLYGLSRNVAREFERRGKRPDSVELDELAEQEREKAPSQVFDKAFATQVMREARECFAARSRAEGGAAAQRLALLELRFDQGLPIRDIAKKWGADAARLHHDFARARKEFKQTLLEVVAEQQSNANPEQVERTARELVEMLR